MGPSHEKGAVRLAALSMNPGGFATEAAMQRPLRSPPRAGGRAVFPSEEAFPSKEAFSSEEALPSKLPSKGKLCRPRKGGHQPPEDFRVKGAKNGGERERPWARQGAKETDQAGP